MEYIKPKESHNYYWHDDHFKNDLNLILAFVETDYIKDMMGGQNIIIFICTFVGINAVFEMIASTLITGAVGTALTKSRLIK